MKKAPRRSGRVGVDRACHPPVRDAVVAARLLAAGWAAVERGLPYEE